MSMTDSEIVYKVKQKIQNIVKKSRFNYRLAWQLLSIIFLLILFEKWGRGIANNAEKLTAFLDCWW